MIVNLRRPKGKIDREDKTRTACLVLAAKQWNLGNPKQEWEYVSLFPNSSLQNFDTQNCAYVIGNRTHLVSKTAVIKDDNCRGNRK